MCWRILISNTGRGILRSKSLTGKKKKDKGKGDWLVNKWGEEHCLIYTDFVILQTWVNSILTWDASPLVQDPQGSDSGDPLETIPRTFCTSFSVLACDVFLLNLCTPLQPSYLQRPTCFIMEAKKLHGPCPALRLNKYYYLQQFSKPKHFNKY